MIAESDEAFSALIREEYERIGCDVGTLREVLGARPIHAQNLWNGLATWTAAEFVTAVSIDGFAERYQLEAHDETSSLWAFISEPYSHPSFETAGV